MFRKLTYLMMLILIGVGSAFGQTGVNRTWNGTTADLVSIDQALLEYKATNATGSVTVTIPSGHGDYSGTHTGYDDAIATVYGLLVENATAMPTSWSSNVTGTTVYKVSNTNTVTLSASRTISGTLVLVGDGTVQSTYANRNISLSGNLILQGNVVLDGTAKDRSQAFIKGTGKLYMADNATIQKCINISTSNLGGAVYLNGSSAALYMAGGVIGDETATMVGTKLPVMLEGYDDYTNCYWGYALSTGNKGNKACMGGGVYLYGGASMFMNGGHISGNEATFNDPEGWGTECGGGGVFSNLSTVTIYGGEISYNLAIAGAGIHSCRPYATTGSSKATLNIYGGTFKWNCAATGLYNNYQNYNCGGAVFSYDSNLAVNGGEFTENRAPMGGGALYIYGGQSQAVIEDMEAYRNYTCWSGTVCMEAAGAEIRGGKFYENESYQGTIACYPVAGASGTPTTTIGKNDGTGPEIYNNKVLFGINLLGMGSDPYQDAYDALGVGGALYLCELNLDVKGGKIYGNTAAVAGGAVFIVDGNCTIEGGELGCSVLDEESGEYSNLGNKALGTSNASEQGLAHFSPDIKGDGGGVYVYYTASASGKKTTISGSNTFIRYNEAERNGGGLFVADGEVNIEGGTFDGNKAKGTIAASTGSNSDGTGNGGGMFVKSTIQTDMEGGALINNVAANNGGGLYLKSTFNMTGGSFGTSSSNGNIATNGNGGGVYVDSNTTTGDALTVSNGTFSGNKAEAGNGGGFYVAKGNVSMQKGSGTGNAITVSNGNKAINGGGFYVNNGNVTLKDANIASNVATGDGGGVYSNGGKFTISNTSGFAGGILSNTAVNGGGFYVNGGELKLEGGTIGSSGHPNDAVNGGGFYIQGGSSIIEGGTVQYNTATNGAGLYMKGTSDSNKATATFSDGTFSHNTASSAGGGIYIDDYAELTMKGNSQITDNTVDAGGAGAGVFKRGETKSLVMVSGSGSSSSAEVKIFGNTINSQPNNLYLDQYDDYLTIDAEGGLPEKMQLGVSVNTAGPKPLPTRVIRCTDFDILNGVFTKLMEAYNENNPSKDDDGSFIYDDAERFLPVFASAPEPFTFEYIFFAEVWPSPYPEIPEDFNPGNISTPDELTYFMMKVNGIRCEKNAAIDGNVVADIDMSGRFWIPIGGYQASALDVKVPYSGVFHGNGHTISGLECIGLTGTTIYGLFGDTQGATIENVNLADCNMTSGQADYIGLLVGKMTNGQVLNCNVSGTLDASGSGDGKSHEDQNDGGFIGGLVGGTFGDEVHIKNVISTVDIVAEFHKDSEGHYDNDKYIEDSRTVGGLVGITSAGTVIENGFANPTIEHGSWFPRYVGGLVGYNEGTLTNCYVRLERGVTLNIVPGETDFYYNSTHYVYNGSETKSKFGMLAGYNATSNKISYCYYPDESIRTITYAAHSATPGITYQGTVSENCKIYHPVVRPYTYGAYLIDNQVDNGTAEATTLLSTLNRWVGSKTGYSHWMRTEGSDVNDDYPVLSYDNLDGTLNYTTVGSKDGVRLEYDNSFNGMYGRFKPGKKGCLFIYKTPDETITADNTASDNHISIYVEEDVALLQSGDAPTLKNVYTCQVLKGEAWHTVASSLTGSKTGFIYGMTDQVQWNENTNPCSVTLGGSANSIFPTGTPVDGIDLYCFYEPQYHWVNLKRNQQSHWHMNSHETPITYDETLDCGYDEDYFADNDENDGTSTLVPGKGYLAAIGKDMILQGDGMLTSGNVEVPVSVEAGSYNTTAMGTEGTELKGYNLLGNPYQSYLSFSSFANGNSGLWSSTPSFAVYDGTTGAYVQGTAATTSKGSFAATGNINMHQGFFIVADNAGPATFTNDMRSDKPEDGTHFRGEAPAYPLVNLVVTDESGVGDVAVVEFDRPEYQSATKMKHIGADGKIYFHYNNEDHALLFLNEDTDQLPVHFDAIENGTYTMTWSTANATFSYLHLVDNMTGIDVDMLSSDAYTFTASSSDYKSRFKLMFAYTGVEENEAAETETFAFMHDGALTVNGEGWLEVIDMSGRTIVSSRLTDAQNTVSLPNAANGLYVLKLTNDNRSKVQKIVVR